MEEVLRGESFVVEYIYIYISICIYSYIVERAPFMIKPEEDKKSDLCVFQ